MTNKYRKSNFRRAAAFAACCLAMGSCTWEEFPELPPESQRPVDLSFTTAVNKVPEPGTRTILPSTDFGSSTSFPVSQNPYEIGMFLSNLNGSEVFEGARNMKAKMTMATIPEQTSWEYFTSSGTQVVPRGFPGAQIRLAAYHPWNPQALADSIPFDFTRKVNTDAGGVTPPTQAAAQTNLLLCSTRPATIPENPASTPIQLGFRNVYTKIVLRVTKREDKTDAQNAGKVTETSIDNLTSDRIKNRGGIDPATGYVKPTSQPGKIWNDAITLLTTNTNAPAEFTFLVPAFMDQDVKDDQFGFVMEIDGEQRIFPLKQSQLNSGRDANGKTTYGFESNKINTYNLEYNNSVLFLSLQSWNSVEASANFGQTAEDNPTIEIKMEKNRLGNFAEQPMQEADLSDIPELNYPKDPTEDPYVNKGTSAQIGFKTTKQHINNTYLSSVLLGGNGPAIQPAEGPKLYTLERPYYHLQVTAIDVGGKAVVWQDDRGGLIAKDVCRNYRGNGFTDWRLPRVTEMKNIMMWAVYNRTHMGKFYGKSGYNDIEKEDATPYWTATEAYMGTPGEVDAQETAWYVQGYINSRSQWNYKVETRNKQDAAFIRCVREM